MPHVDPLAVDSPLELLLRLGLAVLLVTLVKLFERRLPAEEKASGRGLSTVRRAPRSFPQL